MRKKQFTEEELKERKKLRNARYYAANREIAKAQARDWNMANQERAAANKKAWSERNAEKEKERKRLWRLANPEKARASVRAHYQRNPHKKKAQYRKNYDPAKHRARYKTDPKFKAMRCLRSRLRLLVKRAGGKKSASTMTLAGCTLPFLMNHLESLFKPGMTWKNHGFGTGRWNIDHIRPCAAFDLTDAAQQRACFHYSNLQPLWHEENALKADRV